MATIFRVKMPANATTSLETRANDTVVAVLLNAKLNAVDKGVSDSKEPLAILCKGGAHKAERRYREWLAFVKNGTCSSSRLLHH